MQIKYTKKESNCSFSDCQNPIIEKGSPLVTVKTLFAGRFSTRNYHTDCYVDSIKKRILNFLLYTTKPEEAPPKKRGRRTVFTDKEKQKRYRTLEVSRRYHRRLGHTEKVYKIELEMISIVQEFRPLNLKEQKLLYYVK